MNLLPADYQELNVMLALVEGENAAAISNRFESGGYTPRGFAFDGEAVTHSGDQLSNMSVLVISKAFLSRYHGSVDQWLVQNRTSTAIIGIDDERMMLLTWCA